jgi:nitroimidazol reductase NimA-like FMN-containing flavoprotein (pyridoxamine 5'-phosphate oxidase superfamily)
MFLMTRPLTNDETWDVLRAGRLGHLGCVDQDGPYVVPVNYLIAEDCVYSHSLPGRKISALRMNPRACLQVDQIQDDFHWRSAIAFGTFEEVTSADERNHVLRRLLERFPKLTPVESQLAQDAAPPPVIAFRLKLDRISGVAEE